MREEEALQQIVNELIAATSGVQWSICITDGNGVAIAGVDADRSLRTASVGKLLLLIELAAQLDSGAEHVDTLISWTTVPRVAGSGLLRHLSVSELSVNDLAVLVAAASDNFATNVLLARIGLENVKQRAASLGLTATALQDQVRDERGRGVPATLSCGSADELSRLMAAAARDELVSLSVSKRLRSWLGLNADTSMVASAFDLDPLEHGASDQSAGTVALFNKTGTDIGIRADVGWLQPSVDASPDTGLAYAVIADWYAEAHDTTAAVLAGMRQLGQGLRHHI